MTPAVKTASQRAFEREAVPQMDVLYNFALRMTNNPADAEDLLQETFLKAFRFWDSYQEGTNIRAWLFRIMKNSYINRYRKESREPETVDYDETKIGYAVAEGAEPAETRQSVFRNLLEDDLAEAIARLPDDFRTVLILCDIEGLSYEEIAEFVDIPLGTVRSRLHRARRILRKELSEYARKRGYVAND